MAHPPESLSPLIPHCSCLSYQTVSFLSLGQHFGSILTILYLFYIILPDIEIGHTVNTSVPVYHSGLDMWYKRSKNHGCFNLNDWNIRLLSAVGKLEEKRPKFSSGYEYKVSSDNSDTPICPMKD